MSKYAIIGTIFVGIGIIVGLAWFAKPKDMADHNAAPATNQTQSALTADVTGFDFGTISMAKGKVTHQFKVTNNSGASVSLSKIYTSCMCTVAKLELNGQTYGPFGMEGMGGNTYAGVTLNTGESATVDAIYDPAAHGPAGVGVIDRYIYLQDGAGGLLQLEIKAVVTP